MVSSIEEARQCVHQNKINTKKHDVIVVDEDGNIYLDPEKEIKGFYVKGTKPQKSKEK